MILTVTLNAAVDKRYEVENLRVSQVNRVKKTTCTAGGKAADSGLFSQGKYLPTCIFRFLLI